MFQLIEGFITTRVDDDVIIRQPGHLPIDFRPYTDGDLQLNRRAYSRTNNNSSIGNELDKAPALYY